MYVEYSYAKQHKTPDRVEDLTVIAASSSQINLSWDEPDDNGFPITGYQIVRQSQGGWLTIESNTGTNDMTYSDSGLEADTTYRYRVSAINSEGTGKKSIPAFDTTFAKEEDTKPSGNTDQRIPPNVLGIGIYTIKQTQIDNPYSKLLLGFDTDKQTGTFSDFIPYSKKSDQTDLKYYGKFADFEKRGSYFSFSGTNNLEESLIMTHIPIQIQIRLEDDFQSTKIGHVSLHFGDKHKQDILNSPELELKYDKGKPLTVTDNNSLLKSAKANSSLEEGILWVYFDLEFQKPLLQPDMVVQTWHESRVPAYVESPNILRIVDSTPRSQDEVGLVAEVTISHDTSSPTCKASQTCFEPFNARVLKNGIVSWYNGDSFLHDVESGKPGKSNDIFDIHVMPGKSKQIKFESPGVYNYHCSIHPWATGIVTVQDDSGNTAQLTYDLEKSAVQVFSDTSNGSILVESKDEVFSRTHSLDFIVEGHISEKNGGKSIEVIIIRPDDSTVKLHAPTNGKGFYWLPVKLADTWLEGNYKVISKFRGIDIGAVEFSVSDKTDKGFGSILPQTGFLDRLFRDYLEGQISLEVVNSVLSEKKIPNTARDMIKDRLEFIK